MARSRRGRISNKQSIAVLGFLGISYVITHPALLAFGLLFFILILATCAFLVMRRRNRLRRSGIDEIDRMEGTQFEEYLGVLFRSLSYKVRVTKKSGDFGADLVLHKDGKRIVVQAKRYSKPVGVKAVQEVNTAMAHYGASEGWVVTNSTYTAAAVSLAKSNSIRLIDRTHLIKMIIEAQSKVKPRQKADGTNNVSKENEPVLE